MKLSAPGSRMDVSGEVDTAQFGIDPTQTAHIMNILRNSLYSNKPLAVIREIYSNAWDEHCLCGKGDVPVHVHIPTTLAPEFVCRDFGRGLSPEDVLRVYTLYGASSKRDTNDAVGALGIGSKSPFCLTSSFTVTSWHQGTKSIYSAVLDESGAGKMVLLQQEPCGDESGLEVKVPVRYDLIDNFHSEAKLFFQTAVPRPHINITLPEDDREFFEGGWFDRATHGWSLVMGCIPYRLDKQALSVALERQGLRHYFSLIRGGVYAPIGAVDFSANREDLQYTPRTIKVVIELLDKFIHGLLFHLINKAMDESTTSWEKRKTAAFLKQVGYPVPKSMLTLLEAVVQVISTPPEHFTLLTGHYTRTSKVVTREDLTLLINDTERSPTLRCLNRSDYIVHPKKGSTLDQARAELDVVLREAALDGIPTRLLSEQPLRSTPATVRDPTAPNVKHRARCFRLTSTEFATLSENWELADPPSDEHVYVIINSFIPVEGEGTWWHWGHHTGFYAYMTNLLLVAREFNLNVPPIYGYKSTKKKPLTADDIENGIPLKIWAEKFIKSELNIPEKQELIRTWLWSREYHNLTRMSTRRLLGEIVEAMQEQLDSAHPMVSHYQKAQNAHDEQDRWTESRRVALVHLHSLLKVSSPIDAQVRKIQKAYPLFQSWDQMQTFLSSPSSRGAVIQYLKHWRNP